MRRVAGAACAVVAIAVWVGAGTAGGAPEAPTGWDGTNPFRCELQMAAYGTAVLHPEADPYCVDFDKRSQNITQGGVVDFLSKEPARVAAAVPKCFYFQSDHWRGSIVQDDGTTKTYEWDGHYFFDKATGDGGAWVTNFNVNGQTYDPSQIPGIPPEYSRYMGPGTGGVITRNDIPADPTCVARAEKEPAAIYASGAPAAAGAGASCPAVSGAVGRGRLGPIALGDTEARVHELLGAPARMHRGFLRYCVRGGGAYRVGERGGRSGELGSDPSARAVLLFTTARGLKLRTIGPGSSARATRRTFPRQRRLFALGRTRVLETARASGAVIGVRSGAVRFIAVYDRAAIRTTAGLRKFLARAAG